MKSKTAIITGALVAAASAAAVYFIRKYRNRRNETPAVKRSHHLTQAFARAKGYSNPISN